MSATVDSIAQRVIERLQTTEVNFPKGRVAAMIPDALARVGEAIALSDDFRELQSEFTVTVVLGKVDLSALALIIDSIPKHGFVLLNAIMAKPVPRFESLYAKLATDVFHYSIRGKWLYFKAAVDGSLGTAAGTAIILANRVPTLGVDVATDLPIRFEGHLIDELVNLAFEKMGKTPPSIKAAEGE